jgi:transcriptional regulator with XRE-family HTH domain
MNRASRAPRLNNRLRLWRADHGLTLEEVADLVGLSAGMISLVERGERHLSPMTKARVARCLDVQIRDLFDFEGPADDEPAAQ